MNVRMCLLAWLSAWLKCHHPDAILVAGDHINAGPFPRETLQLLRERGCAMIRGNGDDYIVAYERNHMPPEMRASLQWGAIRWAHAHMPPEDNEFLSRLPSQLTLSPDSLPHIRMVHGSLERANQGIVPIGTPIARGLFEAAELVPKPDQIVTPRDALAQMPEAVLICGHTHIPWRETHDKQVAINPGSAGAPLTGDPAAPYAILWWQGNQWQGDFHAIAYDHRRVRREYERSGLLEAAPGMARACLINVETGINVAWFFVNFAYRLAESRGVVTHPVLPDALWEEACRNFDWARFEK